MVSVDFTRCTKGGINISTTSRASRPAPTAKGKRSYLYHFSIFPGLLSGEDHMLIMCFLFLHQCVHKHTHICTQVSPLINLKVLGVFSTKAFQHEDKGHSWKVERSLLSLSIGVLEYFLRSHPSCSLPILVSLLHFHFLSLGSAPNV